MEILVIIIGIILPVFIIQSIQWCSEGRSYGFGVFCGLCLATLFVIETICISEIIFEPHPKAIDVYQGKTTLKYEVVDGVKVDSVVVFKENYYERQNQKVY